MDNVKDDNYQIIFVNRIKVVSLLMIVTSILTIIVACIGVVNSKIYKNLTNGEIASDFAVAGSVNQDLLSIVCGLLLFIFSCYLIRKSHFKLLVISLGLVGYIFYCYALYTFGIMQTPLYLAYIAIFVLSVYILIMGVLSLNSAEVVKRIWLKKRIRIAIGVFLILVSTFMSIKWISDILLMQIQKDVSLIAAMDLGVVLPACLVFAIMIIKNKAYGIILSGVALVKVFSLCLSIALGTFIAPYFNLSPDYEAFAFFSALAVVSLLLFILYLKGIRVE